MEKIQFSDIKPLSEYEAVRKAFRDEIIALKKHRRVPLGNRISVVFENRETILFQIQEMMRVEHFYDPEKIQDELDTYNPLIPDPGELSASLFIEITESERIQEILDQFQGIDDGKSVYLEIGEERVYGLFEAGHSKEDKISAVHYVRFRLTPGQQAAFKKLAVPVRLVADHLRYRAQNRISEEVRRELSKDFD